MNVKLEESLEVKGLYDPGSRITIINAKLLNKELIKNKKNYQLKTISGWGRSYGFINLNAEIYGIKGILNAFVYDNENFDLDLILGLDSVQRFGLTHDENLNIQFQNAKEKKMKQLI